MYIVVGVPGAGKTTVLNEFVKKNQEWKIINYGTLMFEIAKEYGIKDRDSMRKSPVNIQRKIQEEVGKRLAEISKEKNTILDTHASIKTLKGYLPGLPKKLLENINVEGIVLITAKPEEIAKRRSKDLTRKRDEENLKEIKEHELINKILCLTYSSISGAPFSMITNSILQKAVEELEKKLK